MDSPPSEFNFITHQGPFGQPSLKQIDQNVHWLEYLVDPSKLPSLFDRHYKTQKLYTGVRHDPTFSHNPWNIAIDLIQTANKENPSLNRPETPSEQSQPLTAKNLTMRQLAMHIISKFRFNITEMYESTSLTQQQTIIKEFLRISDVYQPRQVRTTAENFITQKRENSATNIKNPKIFDDNPNGIFLSIVFHRRWELRMLIADLKIKRPPGSTIPLGSSQASQMSASPEEKTRLEIVQQLKEAEHDTLEYLEAAMKAADMDLENIQFPVFPHDHNADKLYISKLEIVAQTSFELGEFYFLSGKYQKSQICFEKCLECIDNSTPQSWIGYFERKNEIGLFFGHVKSIISMCSALLNQDKPVEGFMVENIKDSVKKLGAKKSNWVKIDENGVKQGDLIMSSVNKIHGLLKAKQYKEIYWILVNDLPSMEVSSGFRKMIESKLKNGDKETAFKVKLVNWLAECRLFDEKTDIQLSNSIDVMVKKLEIQNSNQKILKINYIGAVSELSSS